MKERKIERERGREVVKEGQMKRGKMGWKETSRE